MIVNARLFTYGNYQIAGITTLKIFIRNKLISISVALCTACKINEDATEDVSITFLA